MCNRASFDKCVLHWNHVTLAISSIDNCWFHFVDLSFILMVMKSFREVLRNAESFFSSRKAGMFHGGGDSLQRLLAELSSFRTYLPATKLIACGATNTYQNTLRTRNTNRLTLIESVCLLHSYIIPPGRWLIYRLRLWPRRYCEYIIVLVVVHRYPPIWWDNQAYQNKHTGSWAVAIVLFSFFLSVSYHS